MQRVPFGRAGQVLACAALSFVMMGAAKFTPEVTVTYDRFKAQTEVRGTLTTKNMFSSAYSCNRPGIQWVAILPDDKAKPPIIALLTYAPCTEWTYLRCHEVSVLADGQRVRLGAQDHNGDVNRGGGGVSETVTVMLDRDVLAGLPTATRIDLQQCNTEWTLAPEERGLLKAFATKVEEVAGPAPPPPAVAPPEAPRAAPVKGSCTAEQRAAMVKLGLTVEQILAACPE